MFPRHRMSPQGQGHVCPICQRTLMYILYKRHLVFPLLLINLGLFILMYIFTGGDDSLDVSGGSGQRSRFMIDASEFHGQLNGYEEALQRLNRESIDFDNSNNKRKEKDNFNFRRARVDDQNKKCDKITPPPSLFNKTTRWFPVFNDSRTTYVFSAFLDDRKSGIDSKHVVRIIGISSGYFENSRIYCQLWVTGRDQPLFTRAVYNIIPETHDYRYAPAMFDCPIDPQDTPFAVTISPSKCAQPEYFLPVALPIDQTITNDFAICISPLNMHYDDVHSFVENMEINRLLGANKIVLYNNTAGDRLNRYISHYVTSGLVDLIQWQLPVNVHTDPPDPFNPAEIHYFGQVAALNDCLYRYMYRSRYIIFTDLDEVLVPRGNLSWRDMMFNLTATRNSKEGAFMIRNVFFRIDWDDDTAFTDHKTDHTLRLRTQLKLTREEKIWDYYARCKNIVIPRKVVMMGIHFVFQFTKTHMEHKYVSPQTALLHHYRDWGDEIPPPSKLDPYMRKYRSSLHDAVIRTHNAVKVLPHIRKQISDIRL